MRNLLLNLLLLTILSLNSFSQTTNVQDGALEFDSAKGHHVNHGLFWKAGVNHGIFFWEAWVKPYPNAQYVISDGYGGQHTLLFGFGGGLTNLPLSGNIFDASTGIATDFGTAETVEVNQWCHIAVGWDGQKIVSFINGVPSSIVPYTGQRSTLVSSGSGVLFIGGSDHNNFNGKIARVRGFEGVLPVDALASSFMPETYFRSTYIKSNEQIVTASFLADYSASSKIYADLSLGYQGANHVGLLSKGTDLGTFGFKPTASTDLPVWTPEPITPPVYTPTTISIPSGVKVYDSFDRANSTPAFGLKGLGVADKSFDGSKPAGRWQGTYVNQWGILNERAYNSGQYENPVWLETGAANMDVRVRRLTGAFSAGTAILIYRYQNDANYGFAYASEGNVYLVEVVNGLNALVRTGVQTSSEWIQLRVLANGGQVSVFCDSTQVITTTSPNLATATKAGMKGFAATGERFDNFAVYPVN